MAGSLDVAGVYQNIGIEYQVKRTGRRVDSVPEELVNERGGDSKCTGCMMIMSRLICCDS